MLQYRVFDKETGQFWDNHYPLLAPSGIIYTGTMPTEHPERYVVQFGTDDLDAHGRDVFVGDIVGSPDGESPLRGVVCFGKVTVERGGAGEQTLNGFYVACGGRPDGAMTDMLNARQLAVMGNICEDGAA